MFSLWGTIGGSSFPCKLMSCFKKRFGLSVTLTISPHQETSGTRRNWATTVSSSTRSRWRPGTAARREPCTASLYASTSSLSANLAGKVSHHHICVCVCEQRFQTGLSVPYLYIHKRRCSCLFVITWVFRVSVCLHCFLHVHRCAYLCGLFFVCVLVYLSLCATCCSLHASYFKFAPSGILLSLLCFISLPLALIFFSVYLSFYPSLLTFPPWGTGLSSLAGLINNTLLRALWFNQYGF